MGLPAAKEGDQIVATDMHMVLVPAPPGPPVPTLLPHPFSGVISGDVSTNVLIMGRGAALVGSTATNEPPHLPSPPGVGFQVPPTNLATITVGSGTVLINNRPVARQGDTAVTCNDPAPEPVGQVMAEGNVLIG